MANKGLNNGARLDDAPVIDPCPVQPLTPQETVSDYVQRLARIEFTVEGTERGPPPSYDEAINPADAPPPTYESVIGRVREAHKQSSGSIDFVKRLVILLAGTVSSSVVIIVTVIIPFAMVLLGAHYYTECPLEPNIPLYLFVGGLLCAFRHCINLFHRFRSNRSSVEEEENIERGSSLISLMNCFMTAWFVLGSYWVYKEYEPNYSPLKGPYCDQVLYLFAFWQITGIYIFFGIMTICLCSFSLCVLAFARKNLRVIPPQDHESFPDPE